ncbi:hypothetical protein EGJ22_25655 [Pseudomonas sp. p99-361]|nr:hypothetical protein D3M70_14865 [Pseudomonas sp. LS-2]RRV02002.1 hypothetical protein EGJ22_25655 [Pseudomonas sp. p99-361]
MALDLQDVLGRVRSGGLVLGVQHICRLRRVIFDPVAIELGRSLGTAGRSVIGIWLALLQAGGASFHLLEDKMALSLVGSVAMTLVLIIWQKPGRYRG